MMNEIIVLPRVQREGARRGRRGTHECQRCCVGSTGDRSNTTVTALPPDIAPHASNLSALPMNSCDRDLTLALEDSEEPMYVGVAVPWVLAARMTTPR